MKLDHFTLFTGDLERMREFYLAYFDVTVNSQYHNPKTGLSTYFLTFAGGGRLEIMQRPDVPAAESGALCTGYVHLAVQLGSRKQWMP